MKREKNPTVALKDESLPRVFVALFGSLLGLALLKFGNPAILDKLVERPTNIYEWVLSAWPIAISYWLLGVVTLIGWFCISWRGRKISWLAALPAVWFIWQIIAGTRTINPGLTIATVKYFAACVACFYLGYFALSRAKNLSLFWLALLIAFALVLWSGFDQHFGGLEDTRRHFYLYIYPQLQDPSPELLKRISSQRIFATLFYPNALAGAVLMLLPVSLAFLWGIGGRMTAAARGFLMALLALASLACLYWSRSKGGWLLMLLLGLVALLHTGCNRKLKIALVAAVLMLGLTGFAWRYATFFQHGATSVTARFDYWHAALVTAGENPIIGTGPGTFFVTYQKIKKPGSEMSRLAHNDYLQQACDSGLPGFLSYSIFIWGALWITYRKIMKQFDWPGFCVWLGLLGWAVQGLFEFGLYIPALAWPAFALLGWLLAKDETGRGA